MIPGPYFTLGILAINVALAPYWILLQATIGSPLARPTFDRNESKD